MSESQGPNRRDFIMAAGAVAAAGLATSAVHANGKEEIKVGLIGCGGRGTGAMMNAIEADPRVKCMALADVFGNTGRRPRGVEVAQKQLALRGQEVDSQYCFTGFDAYKKVLGMDLDYVILATPPYFRPEMIEAAIDAGKNVFAEKPVGVDPQGCVRVMKAGAKAKEKGLSIAAGTQRRHEKVYLDAYKMVQDGAIGDVVAGQVYWNGGQLWYMKRDEVYNSSNAMAWMIQDWVNWSWLSGDHIVEQHVHNIDVFNWFKSKDGGAAHPVEAVGFGARHRRVTGDQYDFHCIDYTYEDGAHLASYCRQISGCANEVAERIVGTKGHTYSHSGAARVHAGDKVSEFLGQKGRQSLQTNPYVQEHKNLIDSITGKGPYLNEAHSVATSTLTAVMGRIASYTGAKVTWKEVTEGGRYYEEVKLGPKNVDWDAPLADTNPPVPGRA